MGILDNLPMRPVAWVLRPLLFPLAIRYRGPTDLLSMEVARGLVEHGEARVRHSSGIYTPAPDEPGLGFLETALVKVLAAAPLEKKMRQAEREGKLGTSLNGVDRPALAVQAGVLSEDEATTLRDARSARAEAVHVDSWSPDEFRRLRG